MQMDSVVHWQEILQMAVLELICKVCGATLAEKGKYTDNHGTAAQHQHCSTAAVDKCAISEAYLSFNDNLKGCMHMQVDNVAHWGNILSIEDMELLCISTLLKAHVRKLVPT